MSDSQTVLVVDDEEDMRFALRLLLEADGFVVREEGTAAGLRDRLAEEVPDLVILDLGLPDGSGHEALSALRSAHVELPVLVLSGRSEESERVLALELGADDYVVKPFLNRELVARVKARLRRPTAGPAADDALGDDGLRIDVAAREVHLDGEPVPITTRELDLLAFLASSPRRVFSREELLEQVWGSSAEWQQAATVTEHVHRLRSKIGAQRIVTVRGAGYRFEPVVGSSEVAE